jgi:hypothetical protein
MRDFQTMMMKAGRSDLSRSNEDLVIQNAVVNVDAIRTYSSKNFASTIEEVHNSANIGILPS